MTSESSPAPKRRWPPPPTRERHIHGIDPKTMRRQQYKVSPWNEVEIWGSCRCGATWSSYRGGDGWKEP